MDVSTLGDNIATLNTSTTFAPLQPLHDTDVAGFLRHAHEQTLIASIEEGRRDTQAEFYRVLDERVRRDWEARKKRIFEELGARGVGTEARSGQELRQSVRGLTASVSATVVESHIFNASSNLPTSHRHCRCIQK